MTDAKEWLIRKNGYFYRPNKSGYTLEKAAAGRYTKDDADREAAIEPHNLTVIHESEVEDAPQVVDMSDEITTLRKELAEARAVTPEKIAAAWAAWHSRHGGKLGPGPAFVEAIEAAIRPPSNAKGEKK